MSLTRRMMLKALGTAPISAPHVVKAMQTERVPTAAGVGVGMDSLPDNSPYVIKQSGWQRLGSRMRDMLYDEQQVRDHVQHTQYWPAHISSKRSWSAAYKEHVLSQEVRAFRQMQRALEKDETFVLAIAKRIGLKGW